MPELNQDALAQLISKRDVHLLSVSHDIIVPARDVYLLSINPVVIHGAAGNPEPNLSFTV